MKKLIWQSGARKRIRDFPELARREAGEQLWRVQNGGAPLDWRPMPTIGTGTVEIRMHNPHEYRVVYVAIYDDGIYVLHAFEKKTQKTLRRDIARAKINYAEMQQERANRGK